MSDFNAENDRFLYEIEQFCIENNASDFLHYFLRFNYNMILERKDIRLILIPIDTALHRLVDKSGKSLEQISILPEGIDVFNNFLSSRGFYDEYPVYTAINGTTYGKTRADIETLKIQAFNHGISKFNRYLDMFAIDGIIRRNGAQIDALAKANPPYNLPKKRNGIIGNDPTTDFDDLPNPILRQIALNLSLSDVVNNCRINNKFNSLICDSEDFWNEKTRRDHPENRSMIAGTWKNTYIHLSMKLYTFGLGEHGQLGHGNLQNQRGPRLVEKLRNVTMVSCGREHTAVISNGRLYTFGSNEYGQLGHGEEYGQLDQDQLDDEDDQEQEQLKPRQVEGLENVTFVACGNQHTAVIAGGQLYTFGGGDAGQLGHGDRENKSRPTRVEGFNNVTFVSCGGQHTAVISNRQLYTFGWGGSGQLGHGDEQQQSRPRLVSNFGSVDYVSCGFDHTAVISGGQLYTFGYNGGGELGIGNRDNRFSPILIDGLDNVTLVSCGSQHTAVISNGKLYTFGFGSFGQLGYGNDDSDIQLRPRLVEGLDGVTSVSCGGAHTAVLVTGGQLYTFGSNLDGQLGYTGNRKQFIPRLVKSLINVFLVSCGNSHTATIAL